MLLQPQCPCNSAALYSNCCEPYIIGKALAPTAEALMRSRYIAYSQGNIDYLITTLHPKSRQKDDRSTLLQSVQTMRWIRLAVIKTQKGQPQDKRGMVEFVALYQPAQIKDLPKNSPVGATHQLHERSRFVKEAGQWFYVDGDILPPVNLQSIPSSSRA
jgi:SEC-C motif domain protein